jgi:hypothetical protein
MRTRTIACVAAGIFAFLLAPVSTADASETGIEIRVISAETRRALEGVEVAITARDGETSAATTNSEGVARIVDLDPGLYALNATGSGLVEALEPSVRVVARSTTPVRLEMMPVDEGLDEVVVVARAVQADPHGAVSSTFLNREELRSAVGAGSDVMRALDGLPGLVSTGDFANFSVRGRGPRDNLIFVDGLPSARKRISAAAAGSPYSRPTRSRVRSSRPAAGAPPTRAVPAHCCSSTSSAAARRRVQVCESTSRASSSVTTDRVASMTTRPCS